uniref:Uncharacterized protein n=1 Tax=Globisporangium ultimum (strain ATCC 200006 / CBS 805.95 / DAOM BR144) TaxID=431595 RepID=K3W8A7_GLOUD
MASWIKNMKGGATRLKDEFVRSLGTGAEGSIDPVFDYRAQRFNRYNESLDKLSKSMAHFMDASQAYAQASAHLMHSFSAFFESQLQDYAEDEEGYVHAKSLAQSALRLEEVHQSLQANIFGSAREMQLSHVMRSVQEIKKNNAGLQKQIQVLKQRLIFVFEFQFADYDSVRRSAESQKRGTPDFERMAQRQQVAEAGLVTLTNEINTELNAVEARRSVDMKNELLTVVACQLFVHTRAQEHFQQLLPLLPGIAKPLLQIAEHARARPRENPAASAQDGSHRGGATGVIAYTGLESRGVIEHPLQFHQKFAPVDDAAASVHPMQTALPFTELHFAEKLAVATYGRRQ